MEVILRPIGRKVGNFLVHMFHMARFFARLVAEFRHFFFYRRQVIDQCYSIGVGSFPLVCLVSAFSGMARVDPDGVSDGSLRSGLYGRKHRGAFGGFGTRADPDGACPGRPRGCRHRFRAWHDEGFGTG